MDTEDGGPTLAGLAHRLEAQTQRLEVLERENSALRRKVATLDGPETERDVEEHAPDAGEGVSRRALLGKAAAAAVAATAAGTLLSPREARAETFASVSSQTFVAASTFVIGNNGVSGLTNSTAPGVQGVNDGSGTGVRGHGGVTGVRGVANSVDGSGVEGEGDTGVKGVSSRNDFSGVYGQHTGAVGYGVVGDGRGPGAGVLGRNSAGNGVLGEGRYGGKFVGNRAQLLLAPKSGTGRPTSGAHSKGEVYMDSAAALFVCTASGSPGTWRRVTTTAA